LDRDVLPAVDYLKNNSTYKFVEVNGEQTVEQVRDEMFAKIGI